MGKAHPAVSQAGLAACLSLLSARYARRACWWSCGVVECACSSQAGAPCSLPESAIWALLGAGVRIQQPLAATLGGCLASVVVGRVAISTSRCTFLIVLYTIDVVMPQQATGV